MNTVQEIRRINEAELASGSTASWHDQYKDSAYIHVGGLPYQLTEGDIITIFSQYGEVVDVTLPRDPNTQKPRGFAFLMYADQRSTVLAVDNLGGAKVLDRTLKVDHVLNYKQLERDNETGKMKERETQSLAAHPDKFKAVAAVASDDSGAGSDSSHGSIDIDDPMRDYLIEQRRAARKAGGDKKRGRDGESKEERKKRREEKRRAKEEKARKKEMKALGAGGSSRSKAIEGGSRSEREPARRRDERERLPDRRRDERDQSPRRRDDRSYGRERSPGRGGERDARDSRRDDGRRDDRDDRDRRRRDDDEGVRRPGGRSSAFADLEQWAKGK